MGISEALIIYLAVGVPLGVYAIMRPKNSLRKNLVGLLAANVLFWPIFASLEFIPRSENRLEPNYFVDSASRSTNDLDDAREPFTASLAKIADRTVRRAAVDAFDRFAALSRAASDQGDRDSVSIPEIFGVAGHTNPQLAAKCLFRKNLTKLNDHRRRAGADLRFLAEDLELQDQSHFETALVRLGFDLRETSVS